MSTEFVLADSGPPPAQPSEGAMFIYAKNVPVGWEYRKEPDEAWTENPGDWGWNPIVEARPKPEPLVAVMLPRSVVETGAEVWADVVGLGVGGEHWFDAVQDACRAALAEADQ